MTWAIVSSALANGSTGSEGNIVVIGPDVTVDHDAMLQVSSIRAALSVGARPTEVSIALELDG
jgi:hypothetical protein